MESKNKDREEKHYLLKTKYTDYYVTIITNYHYFTNKPSNYTLFLGGLKKGCVEISIDANNTADTSIATMTSIKYFPTLEAGIRTQHMINTALSLLINEFPHIKSIKFDDTEVSLAHYYIALFGGTWYEKKFQALLLDTSDREQYYNKLKLLYDKNYKCNYVDFISKYRFTHNTNIENLYNLSDTYRDFFDKLKQYFSNKESLCDFLQTWIEDFINSIMTNSKYLKGTWIINKNDIKIIEYENKKPLKNNIPLYMDGGMYLLNPKNKLYVLV
jgi:hypothetical protein